MTTPPDDFNRRLGRFTIAASLLEEAPGAALRLLENAVVLRAERRFDMQAIEYAVRKLEFDPVPEGHLIPVYAATLVTGAEGELIEVRWEQVTG